MKEIIKLFRPHQWLKNTFIFLPLFFDKHLLDINYIIPAIIAFFSYCFAASGIYCFNDVWDVEKDKLHPIKSQRPIAKGVISKRTGYLLFILCLIFSFLLIIFRFGKESGPLLFILSFYVILNVAYCIRLKNIALVDVFIIAVGFVLRIIMGGVATNIILSQWIVLMTFLLALFLAFAKRRDDVVIFECTGIKARNNINRYNLPFMNQAITIIASITMVCYIMYTVSPEVINRIGSHYLFATSIFVLAGILRYLQITIVDERSGSPTNILIKDHFIQFCILGWSIIFLAILYL